MMDTDTFFAKYFSPKQKQPRNMSSSDNRPFNLTAAQIRLSPPCAQETKHIDSSRKSFLRQEQIALIDKNINTSLVVSQAKAFEMLKQQYKVLKEKNHSRKVCLKKMIIQQGINKQIKEEFQDCQLENKKLYSEIVLMQNEIKDQDQKFISFKDFHKNELQAIKQNSQKEYNQYLIQIDQLNNQINSLGEELQIKIIQQSHDQSLINGQIRIYEDTSMNLQSLKNSNLSLFTQINHMESEKKNDIINIEHLSQKLTQSDNQNSYLALELQRYQSEFQEKLNQTQDQLSYYLNANKSLQNICEQNKHQNTEKDEDLQKFQSQFLVCQQENQNQQTQLIIQQGINQQIKEEFKDCQLENKQLYSEIVLIRNELKDQDQKFISFKDFHENESQAIKQNSQKEQNQYLIQIDQLSNQITSLGEELQIKIIQKSHDQSLINGQIRIYEDTSMNLQSFKNSNLSLVTQINHMESEKKIDNINIEHLSQKITQSDNQNISLALELQRYQNEFQQKLNQTQDQLSYYLNANKSLQIICEQNKQQNSRKDEDLQKFQSEFLICQEKNQNYQKQLIIQQGINEQIKDEFKDSQLENKQFQSEIVLMQNELKDQGQKFISSQSSHRNELQAIKQTSQKEQNHHLIQIDKQNNQIASLGEELQIKIIQQSHDQSLIADQTRIYEDASINLQTLKNSNLSLITQINHMQSEKQNDNINIEHLSQKLTQSDNQNSSLALELERYQNEFQEKLNQTQDQLSYYFNANKSLQIICEQNKQQNSERDEDLYTQYDNVSRLEKDMELQNQIIQDRTKALNDIQFNYKDVFTKLEKLDPQLIEVQTQLRQQKILKEQSDLEIKQFQEQQKEMINLNLSIQLTIENQQKKIQKDEQQQKLYDSLFKDNQKLINQNQSFKDQVMNLSSNNQESEKLIHQVKSENFNLNNQLKNLFEQNSFLEEQKSSIEITDRSKINSLKIKLKQSEYEYQMILVATKNQEEQINETVNQYKKKIQELNTKVQELHIQVREKSDQVGIAQFSQEDIEIKLQILQMKDTALKRLAISIVKQLDPKVNESQGLSLEDYMELAIEKATQLRKK